MRFPRLIVFIVATLIAGCMSMQPVVNNPTSLQAALKPGDKVEIETRAGDTVKLTVTRIDENGLDGDGRHIDYNEIASLSRRKMDGGTTALVVLGAVAVGALAAGGGGSGGGGSY